MTLHSMAKAELWLVVPVLGEEHPPMLVSMAVNSLERRNRMKGVEDLSGAGRE